MALYRLIATTAAPHLGLTPTVAPLDSTSFYVEGRYNPAAEPDAHVIPITRSCRRALRPNLNQVMLALNVENYAGRPLLWNIVFARLLTPNRQRFSSGQGD